MKTDLEEREKELFRKAENAHRMLLYAAKDFSQKGLAWQVEDLKRLDFFISRYKHRICEWSRVKTMLENEKGGNLK